MGLGPFGAHRAGKGPFGLGWVRGPRVPSIVPRSGPCSKMGPLGLIEPRARAKDPLGWVRSEDPGFHPLFPVPGLVQKTLLKAFKQLSEVLFFRGLMNVF